RHADARTGRRCERPAAVSIRGRGRQNNPIYGNSMETAALTKAPTAACIRITNPRVCSINRDPPDARQPSRGHGKEGVDGSSPSEGFYGYLQEVRASHWLM